MNESRKRGWGCTARRAWYRSVSVKAIPCPRKPPFLARQSSYPIGQKNNNPYHQRSSVLLHHLTIRVVAFRFFVYPSLWGFIAAVSACLLSTTGARHPPTPHFSSQSVPTAPDYSTRSASSTAMANSKIARLKFARYSPSSGWCAPPCPCANSAHSGRGSPPKPNPKACCSLRA